MIRTKNTLEYLETALLELDSLKEIIIIMEEDYRKFKKSRRLNFNKTYDHIETIYLYLEKAGLSADQDLISEINRSFRDDDIVKYDQALLEIGENSGTDSPDYISEKLKAYNRTLDSIRNRYNYLFTTAKMDEEIKKLREYYEQTISNLSEDLKIAKDEVTRLKPEIEKVRLDLDDAGITATEFKRITTSGVFDEQNEILSGKFRDKHKELKKECERNRRWAIGLTSILGTIYILVYACRYIFHSYDLDYTYHLMLIAVCTPFIFLTVWLFFQVSRLTRLSEMYSYKSSLGVTIRAAIDFVKYTEGDDKEKTLEILKELLCRLYENPLSNNESHLISSKQISEITKTLKEIKGLTQVTQ